MNELTNPEQASNEFEKLLAESQLNSELKEGTIIKGTISELDDDAVTVDIGAKVEGRIAKREFIFSKDKKELEIGDVIDVYLEKIENHYGDCILSRSKAKNKEIWAEIEKSFNAGELVDGVITGKVKGGLSAEIGITAFLPGSQIDTRPLRDVSHLLDVPQKFKVLKMDAKRNNIVVSRRAVLEETHKELREERFSQLALGDVVEGRVKAITDYGAFVDLGGYDSLLHSSDITYRRIGHPSEILKIDQIVKVKIIKVDPEKNRVSCGLKQLEEDPWTKIEGKFNIGDKLQGTCTNVTDYGIFIEVDNGIEGLAHRDMLTWSSKKNSQPGNLYARSQSVECIVLEVDYVKKRLSLGVKQLTANPFEKYNELNPIGTIVDTEIKAIKDNIIFCSLEEDIDGAIFSQNISWDSHEDSKDQMQKFNVGDKIKAKIIENKNDKIALSIREVDGNPFDEIKDKSVGDTVTCTVSEVTDYGVKVMVGVNGPKVVIKKNDLALRKPDARPERWARNDKLDAMISQIDVQNFKVSLSIKALEEATEKEAISKYGAKDSGASLGDILGKAISDKKTESEE
ncbi:30S ribosomal protein S1 [Pelagibacterales bacterium]|jgi:small subunit ribosomal protein S1|nr:30S ribosomal protein S1 [Pelagibacterales bacterium]MDB9818819.1 30S ribosomal protein S1 [Pelagibacterales bacterium]MDB9955263.1 30S ribosomal protein S1 [Pelagibacterales bacterium]|tara:strand:- start:263 stop:1972 length:1710 start_codon:yes stop_codon:yes gene_type:complete